MSDISTRLEAVRATLPCTTDLIAVSKYHPLPSLLEAYRAGQRRFGENRVQELLQKAPLMPSDTEWHLIGTLQRNKVKHVLPYVHTIHSVDSPRLLLEIRRQALRLCLPPVRILLQVDVTQDDTKHGWKPDELTQWLRTLEYQTLDHIRFCGLMAMASHTSDTERIEREFETVSILYGELRKTFFADSCDFCRLSMGMTEDYPLALKYGANYVRIGSAIFGPREY